MRRQLHLQDYSTPSFQYNITSTGTNNKKQFGFNTQYKTSKVQIQTLIVNGNKQSFSSQVNEKLISHEINLNNNNGNKENGNKQNGQNNKKLDNEENQYIELNEEQQKKLDKFVRKVTPLIEKELNQNLSLYSSNFFKISTSIYIELGLGQQKHYFKKQTRLTYTLQNLDINNSTNNLTSTNNLINNNNLNDKLIVSDIAWNSTGVMLAAVYAKAQHDTSCSHKSMICLWSMFKRNFKPTKPEIIYTNNCISCIQFHPKKPSVLVVGNYIGEILLYDLTKKPQQLLAKTQVDDYFHRDVISQLSWWPFKIPGKSQVNYNILSLGTDGKILLWQIPTICLSQQAPVAKLKSLLKYPIKGFTILRKKQGIIIPVAALSMKQSKQNKNVFIIGSQGGSILKANLTPINHYMNTQSKILLDMQQPQGIKYKKQVYPFLLNVPSKQFRQLKQFIQKSAKSKKIQQIDSVSTIYSLKPDIKNLYPNSIIFAYQPLSYPISSVSINKYGLFIANGCDGYSRVYIENRKQHLQSFQQGYEWGWINQGTKLAGFVNQEFLIVDWITGAVVYNLMVGEGAKWKEISGGGSVAVVSQKTKVKVIQLGDKISKEEENFNQLLALRINDLTNNNL